MSKSQGRLSKSCRVKTGHIPAGFSFGQLKRLLRPVDPRHVHSREIEGRQLSYIEGWYAIAQANAIFGYGGWDREMVHFERVTDRREGDNTVCGYIARVRIRVRAGASQIVREGSGWGWATARINSAAHERALKSAETDATKRALATFGPSFGLSLYDKDANAHRLPGKPGLVLVAPDGTVLADALSPEAFSTGLRQLVEHCREPQEIESLRVHNQATITELKANAPTLRNAQGTHFADLLFKLLDKAQSRCLSGTRTEPAVPPVSINPIETRPASANGDFKRYVGQAERRKVEPAARPQSRTNGMAINGSAGHNLSVPPQGHISQPPSVSVGQMVEADAAETAKEQARRPVASESQGQKTKPDEAITANANAEIIAIEPAAGSTTNGAHPGVAEPSTSLLLPPSRIAFGQRIDKALLPLGYERRLRDKAHLRHVAELPCLVCSRQPSHAHHLRFAQRRGLGQKVSDEYVVPLCALHHGDLHRSSSEKDWWNRQKIDPVPVSNQLWENNRH